MKHLSTLNATLYGSYQWFVSRISGGANPEKLIVVLDEASVFPIYIFGGENKLNKTFSFYHTKAVHDGLCNNSCPYTSIFVENPNQNNN